NRRLEGRRRAMRRGLIIKIAVAAEDALSYGTGLSYKNLRRYVTRELLTHYCVKRETRPTEGEYMMAFKALREDRRLRGTKNYLDSPLSTRLEYILRRLA
ncbi:MAG: hypothetical protein NWE76_09540, partial [Candidatus Bathyarchaeota archaeon]|nr:hypothetical protein [Candidatus Bathyarchaeota archaeon]